MAPSHLGSVIACHENHESTKLTKSFQKYFASFLIGNEEVELLVAGQQPATSPKGIRPRWAASRDRARSREIQSGFPAARGCTARPAAPDADALRNGPSRLAEHRATS